MTQSALRRENDRKLLNRLVEQQSKAWHGHDMAMTKPAHRRLSSALLSALRIQASLPLLLGLPVPVRPVLGSSTSGNLLASVEP